MSVDLCKSESEILAALEARDCQPLTPEEREQLCELVRRATGGCLIRCPGDAVPPAKLPAAWLCEFGALGMGHIRRMESIPRNPKLFYDPLA